VFRTLPSPEDPRLLHLYDGEEAVSLGIMQALAAEDAIVATYREHGQALARGVPMAAIMAEMYGKLEGCCRRPRRLDAHFRPQDPVLRR
jgi:TPP-dependent pyruvate/acetoin dehydrogenase alpha subunit